MSKRNLLTLTLLGLALFGGVIAAVGLSFSGARIDTTALAVANQLYQAGHTAQAIQAYEQLVAQGARDSVLFYNLGNAYMQQGDLGRANLNYQRAARLDPRVAYIQDNLAYARAKVVDPLPDAPGGPLDVLAKATERWLTLNEAALLALGLWFLFGGMLLAWRQLVPGRTRTGVAYAAIFALLLVAVTGLSLGSRIYAERTQPVGVVVADVLPVSSDPMPASGKAGPEAQFSLHDGDEIHVVEIRGDWARLSVPGNALGGWVPADSVVTI
jgi:tetratricopeptide (TPR) repeat protein